MAPGTQSAGLTGSSGAVEAGREEDSSLPEGKNGEDGTGGEKVGPVAGSSGTADAGSLPVGNAPGASAPSSSSPGSGDKSKGPWSFAENTAGLPSGQVAPSEAVGEEGKLVFKGTQEQICRTINGLTKVRILGRLEFLGPEGEKKTPTNFPYFQLIHLRVYYRDPERGRGAYVEAEFKIPPRVLSDPVAEATVLTTDPSSLGFFLVAPNNEMWETPSPPEEIPPASPLPTCPVRFPQFH